LEKISLDLEKERNWGCNADPESNIRTNFGHRRRVVRDW
jgi:hypothetical protein